MFSRPATVDIENSIELKIGDNIINHVDETKFLGLIMDKKLTWQPHIDHVKNKISGGLYAINKSKHILRQHNLLTLYYSLIHPYINYGLILWGSASKCHLKKISVMQNKAVRAITSSGYRTSAEPLFKQCKMLPLDLLLKQQYGRLMYQHSTHQLPIQVQNLFKPNNAVHNYNTRHGNDPHITRHSMSFARNSFIHKAPEIWYTVPKILKDSTMLKTFMCRMKAYLLTGN